LAFKEQELLAEQIAARYQLQLTDTKLWLDQTVWSQHNFEQQEFDSIQEQLIDLKILTKRLSFQEIVVAL
jgi:hypothetical protein